MEVKKGRGYIYEYKLHSALIAVLKLSKRLHVSLPRGWALISIKAKNKKELPMYTS